MLVDTVHDDDGREWLFGSVLWQEHQDRQVLDGLRNRVVVRIMGDASAPLLFVVL